MSDRAASRSSDSSSNSFIEKEEIYSAFNQQKHIIELVVLYIWLFFYRGTVIFILKCNFRTITFQLDKREAVIEQLRLEVESLAKENERQQNLLIQASLYLFALNNSTYVAFPNLNRVWYGC